MNEKQLNQLQKSLDQQADSLDAASLSRLRQAREKALDAADKKSKVFHLPVPLALASVCVVALGLIFFKNINTPAVQDDYQQVVNEILLDDTIANALVSEDIDVEFYEDIEFYEWLSQAKNSNAG